MSSTAHAQTLTPPNPLEKAKNGDGPVSMDPSVLQRAEKAVDTLTDDYPSWAQADISGLKQAIVLAETDPDRRTEAIAEVYTRALDLKGQGGGFGYNLITAIGDLLTKFIDGREAFGPREFAIIQAHADAMQAVLRDDIKGGGDKIGMQIVDGLGQLVLPS